MVACKFLRTHHKCCSKIVLCFWSQIVVGGEVKDEAKGTVPTTSVEILDLTTKSWKKGPSVPEGICCGVLVEEIPGSVLYVGGKLVHGNGRKLFKKKFQITKNLGKGNLFTEK